MTNSITTRFAPSPTGNLHIGAYRTALFNYLYTKQNDGKLILRIEDTDKERSKKEYEENIFDSIAWLGLSFDETYHQSENRERHKEALNQLLVSGDAYISKEEAAEGKRSEVIRFKNPNKSITFTDSIRGDITFDTTDLKDFVIAKDFDEPLFHLAVVVDDYDEGVTHIIRGDDHISNTPRQILIRHALGYPDVTYAHIPLILAVDKSKLSKRRGAKSITQYRDEGYLPQALINFMAMLGWNPGTDQEIFDSSQLIKTFSLSKVQKSGAVFNEEKLRWFNKEHLKKLSIEAQKVAIEEWFKTSSKEIILSEEILNKLYPIIIERIETWGDIHTLIDAGEFDFMFDEPTYKKESLLWKKDPDIAQTREYLTHSIEVLQSISDKNFKHDTIKDSLWKYATEKGRGNVLWPIRFALSGRERSPDPFVLAELIGKKVTLIRLNHAVELLS